MSQTIILRRNMIMVGMIGMIDPPREEARSAIAKCRRAGIQPVMITGDHPATAFAIAQALQLVHDDTALLTGAQLELMSDEELRERVQQTSVYARTTAEHKMRIVRAWAIASTCCSHDWRWSERCSRSAGSRYRHRHGHCGDRCNKSCSRHGTYR